MTAIRMTRGRLGFTRSHTFIVEVTSGILLWTPQGSHCVEMVFGA
jgi:hypothetical protein